MTEHRRSAIPDPGSLLRGSGMESAPAAEPAPHRNAWADYDTQHAPVTEPPSTEVPDETSPDVAADPAPPVPRTRRRSLPTRRPSTRTVLIGAVVALFAVGAGAGTAATVTTLHAAHATAASVQGTVAEAQTLVDTVGYGTVPERDVTELKDAITAARGADPRTAQARLRAAIATVDTAYGRYASFFAAHPKQALDTLIGEGYTLLDASDGKVAPALHDKLGTALSDAATRAENAYNPQTGDVTAALQACADVQADLQPIVDEVTAAMPH